MKRVHNSIPFIVIWKNPWIPVQHLRETTCKTINYYPSFIVNHLVDPPNTDLEYGSANCYHNLSGCENYSQYSDGECP